MKEYQQSFDITAMCSVLKVKRKFKVRTTDSNHNHSISPNRLQRDFRTNVPNEVYVGDITYIRTQQGWLYLAVVIDLFSRKVVGWSMDDGMQVSLVNNALQMALHNRKPPPQVIWHTDRETEEVNMLLILIENY